MKALSGAMRSRAEAVIAAGSDVALHCSGDFAEMCDVAAGVPALGGAASTRFEAAMAVTRTCGDYDQGEAEKALAAVFCGHPGTRESV